MPFACKVVAIKERFEFDAAVTAPDATMIPNDRVRSTPVELRTFMKSGMASSDAA
jgi:hypothetical protein